MRIEICLTLLSTEGGGRKRPLGARHAMCWIGNMAGEFKTFNDARLQVIAPGETARAYLEPFAPEYWWMIEAGREIELYDGPSWCIGRAIVLNVSDITHG